MNRFTPYKKMSKKQQRELDSERRISWGAIKPVTRRPERSDIYKRHEEKASAARQARLWKDDYRDGFLYIA